MKVEKTIVIQMPPSVTKKNLRSRNLWAKKAVRKAVWEARCNILQETGLDVFNVFVMTDCVEVTIRGDMEATEKLEGKKLR